MLSPKWPQNVKETSEGLSDFNRSTFWSKILVYSGGWSTGEVIKNTGTVNMSIKIKKKHAEFCQKISNIAVYFPMPHTFTLIGKICM